jgi:hypothetical protein
MVGTRRVSYHEPEAEGMSRAELAGKELDNRLKEARLRRLEIEVTAGSVPQQLIRLMLPAFPLP